MDNLSPELAVECLAEALQTMAFVAVEPPPDAPEGLVPAGPADVYTIRFTGPAAGAFQLAAPRAFGQLLAANIMALDPAGAEAAAHAADAVRELCNVTAGSMLRRLADAGVDPEMGLPAAEPVADAAAWAAFIGQPAAAVVAAEGFPLAVCVKGLS